MVGPAIIKKHKMFEMLTKTRVILITVVGILFVAQAGMAIATLLGWLR